MTLTPVMAKDPWDSAPREACAFREVEATARKRREARTADCMDFSGDWWDNYGIFDGRFQPFSIEES
jgi:hypothetical protein